MGTKVRAFQAKLHEMFVITKVGQKTMEFQVRVFKELCNNFGILHGGAVHLLVQELSSYSVSYHEHAKSLASISVSVNFIAASKENELLRVSCTHFQLSPLTFLANVQLQSNANLLCTASHILHSESSNN
jgi:uncharacterized protein (TIGR00369 family)